MRFKITQSSKPRSQNRTNRAYLPQAFDTHIVYHHTGSCVREPSLDRGRIRGDESASEKALETLMLQDIRHRWKIRGSE